MGTSAWDGGFHGEPRLINHNVRSPGWAFVSLNCPGSQQQSQAGTRWKENTKPSRTEHFPKANLTRPGLRVGGGRLLPASHRKVVFCVRSAPWF